MITTLLTVALERAIRCYLHMDSTTQKKLASLSSKVILIHIEDWHMRLYVLPSSTGVSLQNHYDGTPDVSITGSLSDFAKMGLHKHENTSLAEGLEIAGDTELAQRFNSILINSQIDWEETLSIFTGDNIAHQISNTVKNLTAFRKQAEHNLQENITEYLQEEKRVMPPREEMEDFFEDVYTLKNNVERLQTKIRNLKQKAD